MLTVVAPLGALASPAMASFGSEGFGVEKFENSIIAGGLPASQAGSHPDDMSFGIVFNHHQNAKGEGVPDGNTQNVVVNLPAGLVVNPTATEARCTEAQLLTIVGGVIQCPPASAIGYLSGSSTTFAEIEPQDIYNMVPPPGVSADFATNIAGLGLIIHIVGGVRTGGDYGLSGTVSGITQHGGFFASTVTLWGVPSSESHDQQREPCLDHGGFCPVDRTEKPMLRMPTSCGETLTSTLNANSWQGESLPAPVPATNLDKEGRPVPVTGCESLNFNPELAVRPSTTATSSPSGLSVELSVPQEENVVGLTQADLREAVVTLPAGMSISTSAAGGLGACPLLRGREPEKEEKESKKEVEGINLESHEPVNCPDSSKVGSVEVETPLLDKPLHGALYLAQQGNAGPAQGENPFGSLLALYIVIEGAGLVVKVPGEVHLDPVTGQLTARFGEDPLTGSFAPQVPFSHFRLDFFGDPRAPLSTPTQCGTYTVTSRMTPWSAPESGPPATPSSSFVIDQNCHGPQFHPNFTAGTESNRAGSFSPFTATFRREDSEEGMGRVQVQMPPGLSAMVSSVPLCEEPQAARGTCEAKSLIGHVTTGVGAGPNQFYVPGQVFLTGPYNGAPFGLSIVVPAVAGPFNLGVEVVRAAINVDPHTAVPIVTSQPLPQIIQGVPLQIRTVNVTIDRPGFVFNPTNCTPMSVGGQAASTKGSSVALSSRFQASECGSLAFKPKVKVSTSGHTSRAGGASLDFKLAYPNAPQGSQANIAKAKVELPKQLPSRLTTLQKACPAATFEANPATCPAASVIGIVRATTPLLPGQLTGPVYFVSHGGEAFPNIVFVLQGDNVRADLVGSTFISKKGITSTTLKTVPDVPVGSFEVYLPQGKFSALAANGNLCRSTLKMPVAFTAQNGAEMHQSTPIAVTGCPKKKGGKGTKAGKKAARGANHAHGRRAR